MVQPAVKFVPSCWAGALHHIIYSILEQAGCCSLACLRGKSTPLKRQLVAPRSVAAQHQTSTWPSLPSYPLTLLPAAERGHDDAMMDADDELQRALAMSMQDHGPSEQSLGDSQEVSYTAHPLLHPFKAAGSSSLSCPAR